MLAKWINKDVDASWRKVIDALGSMSQIRLTKQIMKKYTFDAAPGHCVYYTGSDWLTTLDLVLHIINYRGTVSTPPLPCYTRVHTQ